MENPFGLPTKLNEQQWLQVRTQDFKNWFGNWEKAVKEYIMEEELSLSEYLTKYNVSQVIDEKTLEPLIVFHGSPYSKITEFNRESSVRQKSSLKEFGTYFATNIKLSEMYSKGNLSKEYLDEIDKEINKWKNVRDSSRSNRDFDVAEREIELLQNSKRGKVYPVFLNLKNIKEFNAKGESNIEAWNNLQVDAGYKTAKNRDAMEFLKEGKFGVEKVDGVHAKNIVDAFTQDVEDLNRELIGDVFLVFDGNENSIKSAEENIGTFSTETNDIRFKKGGNKGQLAEKEVIDRLKENGLAENIFQLSSKEIANKLKELGVDAKTRKQVLAYHVSDTKFSRFNKSFIGQRFGTFFGYGFYFTSESGVANYFSQNPIVNIDGVKLNSTASKYYVTNKIDNKLSDSEFLETINNSLNEREFLENFFGEDFVQGLETLREAVENKENISIDGRYKYQVKLNDNFIDWNSQVSNDILIKTLGSSDYNVNGKELYQELKKRLISEKKVSEFLYSKGIDGMRYPMSEEPITKGKKEGYGYVIFDENAITIEEQIQFQKDLGALGITPTVNGFVYKNEVYLNSDLATNETSLHEFSHLFNSWLKENKPKLYNKGIELVKAELTKENSEIKDIIDYVKSTQPNLKGEALLEEILTELTGRKGAELLETKKGGIVDWLKEVWSEIAKMLSLTQMSSEQVTNLTLGQYAEAVGVDLLKGENLRDQEVTDEEIDELISQGIITYTDENKISCGI
jgi:hypothetical protein